LSQWEEANTRLDKTRIYIVGSNEVTEAMRDTYNAAVSWLSVEAYEEVGWLLLVLERQCDDALPHYPYEEQIAARKSSYQFGEDFPDGDNQVEPRFKNW